MGRCQGFYCGAHIPALLAEHLDRGLAELMELPR
jgi:hypothetical protein